MLRGMRFIYLFPVLINIEKSADAPASVFFFFERMLWVQEFVVTNYNLDL
jgi:hypothetical protein